MRAGGVKGVARAARPRPHRSAQPHRPPRRRRVLRRAGLAVLTSALVACGSAAGTPDPRSGLPQAATGPYPVLRVIDGDTLAVRAREELTVRLIGVDTPETRRPGTPVQCFGREATAHAKRLVEGREVYLEYDPTQDRQDRYGRTLAYVWLPGSPPVLLNERLIADGYAHEYTYAVPYRYQERFDAAERTAREGSKGLWAPTTCAGDTDRPAHGAAR